MTTATLTRDPVIRLAPADTVGVAREEIPAGTPIGAEGVTTLQHVKGGSTGINQVYRHAEPLIEHGLVIMDTPSYDPVSATGQIAGGAKLVAFTTGRGSCFGSLPTPTIKLATNTPMYRRIEGDMEQLRRDHRRHRDARRDRRGDLPQVPLGRVGREVEVGRARRRRREVRAVADRRAGLTAAPGHASGTRR